MKTNQTHHEENKKDPLRFHHTYSNLTFVFGNDWFGRQAETFARFFGTPLFLSVQTFIVLVWITLNVLTIIEFDPYPFILLNLAFSLQAAYAAPLILLAQTRQADRDKASAEADAYHREQIASTNLERQKLLTQNSEQIILLLEQNTELTRLTNQLTERIEMLTVELHKHILQDVQNNK